jgi:signal transduction histidine kinase/DNA-binding response OmpR family regulator
VLKKQGHLEKEVNLNRQHSGPSDAIYLVKGELLHSHQGKLQGILLTATDISELKQRELALCQSKEALKQAKIAADTANKAKGDFLAMMSHEIRTPMNVIIGLTDLVLKTTLAETQRTYLKNVDIASNSLLGIINDVLDFSKIDAGKLKMESVPVNLTQLLDNTQSIFSHSAADKGLKFEIKMPKELELNIIADPLRLQQVLSNLVNNAIKFTELGQVTLSACVKSCSVNKVELQFRVADSGIGMTTAQVNSLFKPFTQAENSTSRQYGGTGLGLSICKRLVEMMAGNIWITSESGLGTECVFSARFPLARRDEIVNFASDQRKEIDSIAQYYGARILVVDDNSLNRDLVIALLDQHKFVLDQASNGQEALEAVTHTAYDIVLMDIQMPGMDGLETTTKMRQLQKGRRIPIIALSANVLVDLEQNSEYAGMDDFLVKPISQSRLLATLIRWLKPRHNSLSTANLVHAKKTVNEQCTIDVEMAIKRIGGSREIYFKMLAKFIKQVVPLQQQLNILYRNANYEELAKKIHEIKGLAGIIGASQLYAFCCETEQQLKDSKSWLCLTSYDDLVLELELVALQAKQHGQHLT